jgi:Arc/MetJ-type ribon-helix-helix transcriptional regulator
MATGARIYTRRLASRPRRTGLTCIIICMRQLNLNVTDEFVRDLQRLMKRKGINSKSEAIRLAVREAAASAAAPVSDYRGWLGMALKAPLKPKPRFRDEDSLWS